MSETDFPAESFSSGATADETPLEMALRLALEDGAYRKAFYQELLRTNLVVITAMIEGGEPSHRVAEPGEEFGVVTFGEGLVPVFSSQARIFDGGPAKQAVQSMELPARNLLTITPGNTLLLNPYSAHQLTLSPDEITRLLDGSVFRPVRMWEAPPGTDILISQPAVYPSALVDGMRQLLSGRAIVRRAYLTWGEVPTDGRAAHPIMGLEIEDGDTEGLLREAATTATPLLEAGLVVDFIVMRAGERNVLVDYLRDHVEPFYERGDG